MNSVAGLSATRHRVVTVAREPAESSARLNPWRPSPRITLPRSVSQADSVARSTPRRSRS